MNSTLTEAQRLELILTLEGMPAEPTLDVDSPDCVHLEPEEQDKTADQQVSAALNLDALTPVDVFISSQEPIEYRWQDNYLEGKKED